MYCALFRPPEYLHIQTNFHSLPRTYPSRALPALNVVRPIVGLGTQQIDSIKRVVQSEAETLKGSEMLFQVSL